MVKSNSLGRETLVGGPFISFYCIWSIYFHCAQVLCFQIQERNKWKEEGKGDTEVEGEQETREEGRKGKKWIKTIDSGYEEINRSFPKCISEIRLEGHSTTARCWKVREW